MDSHEDNHRIETLQVIRLERARAVTIMDLAHYPEQEKLCALLIVGGTPLSDAVILLTYDTDISKQRSQHEPSTCRRDCRI